MENQQKLWFFGLDSVFKALGHDVDVHGFLTSFKTWTQERTTTPRDVSEAALAHTVKDKAEAAHARPDFFEKRRTLLDRWGTHCDSQHQSIIQLHPLEL